MVVVLTFLVFTLASNVKALDTAWDFGDTVEIDICSASKFNSYLTTFLDNCRRFCGYDSWAFIKAKQNLNDHDSRIEFVLATLTILKYPAVDDLIESSSYLLKELNLTWPEKADPKLMQEIQSIVSSKSYSAIWNSLKSLSKSEFDAIAQNLRDRDNLLTMSERHQINFLGLIYLEDLLKPILNRLLKE